MLKKKKNTTPTHIIFKLQKVKDVEQIWKEARGEKAHIIYRGTKIRLNLTSQKPCKHEENRVK